MKNLAKACEDGCQVRPFRLCCSLRGLILEVDVEGGDRAKSFSLVRLVAEGVGAGFGELDVVQSEGHVEHAGAGRSVSIGAELEASERFLRGIGQAKVSGRQWPVGPPFAEEARS